MTVMSLSANVTRYSNPYVHVETDTALRYFVVYDTLTDRPIATLTRPRYRDPDNRWSLVAVNCKQLGRYFYVTGALRTIANYYREGRADALTNQRGI